MEEDLRSPEAKPGKTEKSRASANQAPELIPNVTRLYHKTYGQGTFVQIERSYIHVQFGKDVIMFQYPDALGKYLFFDGNDPGTDSQEEVRKSVRAELEKLIAKHVKGMAKEALVKLIKEEAESLLKEVLSPPSQSPQIASALSENPSKDRVDGANQAPELIPNVTRLYHKTYGQGTFVQIERSYIHVQFGKDVIMFQYPDALGKYLFFDETSIPPQEKGKEPTEIQAPINIPVIVGSKTAIEPTEEQMAVLESMRNIDMLSINAFAGTGKTTTLSLIVERYSNKKFLLLAFNRSMVGDLKRRLAGFNNVEICTTHSLAYKHVRHRLPIKIEDERALTKFIEERLEIADIFYAAFLKELLLQYCRSDKVDINASVVEEMVTSQEDLYKSFLGILFKRCKLENIDIGADIIADLKNAYPPYRFGNKTVRQIADDLLQQAAGDLKRAYEKATSEAVILHDLYLKFFQIHIDEFLPSFLLRDYYAVLLDEAQDTNPATFDIFMRIPAPKKVIVGDKHQNIYSWRGARNYLSNENFKIFYLTETFRFGQNIADVANQILARYKGERHRIKPSQRHPAKGNGKTAYITRTNSKIIQLINETHVGRIALLRDLDDILRPILYAREIVHYYKFGKFYGLLPLPEYLVALVKNFGRLEDFETFCQRFDREMFTAIQILRSCKDIDKIREKAEALQSGEANIVLTTAHTAKGREFEAVVVEDDFPNLPVLLCEYAERRCDKTTKTQPHHKNSPVALQKSLENLLEAIQKEEPGLASLVHEINLQYVAVTRAQKELIRKGATFEGT